MVAPLPSARLPAMGGEPVSSSALAQHPRADVPALPSHCCHARRGDGRAAVGCRPDPPPGFGLSVSVSGRSGCGRALGSPCTVHGG